MKLYVVGGAVRDALLGRDNSDRDWVVVGATPAQLMQAGYTPVGRDFPVFLHPQTREEYALARTERKTAPGYHGFTFHAAPDVTLEQDLARRDLTINAMAQAPDGTLIDPHGGQRDLLAKTLRHVSAAFAEDPVRILRLARFAARLPDFGVAAETLELMKQMVGSGEVDALVPERVWQELSRGLMEHRPSRMFEVLRECGALQRLLPEVERLWDLPQRAGGAAERPKDGALRRPSPEGNKESGKATFPCETCGAHLLATLDIAARLGAGLAVRFACLGHAEHGVQRMHDVSERLRVPHDCRELAAVVAREGGPVQRSAEFDADALLALLERCDALRRPQRLDEVLLACECDARARPGQADAPYPQAARLRAAQKVALGIATAAVATQASALGLAGAAIGIAIRAARVRALERGLAWRDHKV